MPTPAGRADFPHFLVIPTRWMDNDVYGHVNNVVYYSDFDTVINEHLIKDGGLDIHDGSAIGYCVESQCRFMAPLAFPETLDAGLRVAHLGKSSVRYEIALFRQGSGQSRGRAVSPVAGAQALRSRRFTLRSPGALNSSLSDAGAMRSGAPQCRAPARHGVWY